MMRALGLALVLAGLALASGVRAAEPGAGAGAVQFADAMWVDGRDFFFATGLRVAAADGGVVTYGVIGRGTCQPPRSEGSATWTCVGAGRGREIDFEDFQMDAALASARLSVRAFGRRHTVEWRGGRDAPVVENGATTSSCGAEGGAGLARDASASGRLFGRSLEARPGRSLAALGEFVAGYVACDGAVVRSVTFVR